MNGGSGWSPGVVLGAFLLMFAGTALVGATLVDGWIRLVLVLAGVALLGTGVSLMTLPALEHDRRRGR